MHKKIVIIIITIIIVVIIILTLVCSLFASVPDVSLLFPYIPISSTGSCQKKPVYNNVKRYTREPDISITFIFFANMFQNCHCLQSVPLSPWVWSWPKTHNQWQVHAAWPVLEELWWREPEIINMQDEQIIIQKESWRVSLSQKWCNRQNQMDNALIKIQQLLRTPLRKKELGNPKAATQGLSNSLLQPIY